MAQNMEPAQRKVLGQLIATVCIDTGLGGEPIVAVHLALHDDKGELRQDTSRFRVDDLSKVAQSVTWAFEEIWREHMPAQPDSGASELGSTDRKQSGRTSRRH